MASKDAEFHRKFDKYSEKVKIRQFTSGNVKKSEIASIFTVKLGFLSSKFGI